MIPKCINRFISIVKHSSSFQAQDSSSDTTISLPWDGSQLLPDDFSKRAAYPSASQNFKGMMNVALIPFPLHVNDEVVQLSPSWTTQSNIPLNHLILWEADALTCSAMSVLIPCFLQSYLSQKGNIWYFQYNFFFVKKKEKCWVLFSLILLWYSETCTVLKQAWCYKCINIVWIAYLQLHQVCNSNSKAQLFIIKEKTQQRSCCTI